MAVKVLRTSEHESAATLKKVSTDGKTRGRGLIFETALLQGGDRLETRVVSLHPQVQWHFLPQWLAGDRHTLDAPRKHN